MSGLAYIAALPFGIGIGVFLRLKVFSKKIIAPDYCQICFRDKNLPSHQGFINGTFNPDFICTTFASRFPKEYQL